MWGLLLQNERNEDAIKLLFKLKGIKKNMVLIPRYLKNIKVQEESHENYKRCMNIYQDASCYYFQCCGFLKSQYFYGYVAPASKKFLINSLFIPGYKRFLELRRTISLLKIDEIYSNNLQLLKSTVETINNSLSGILSELNKI